MKKIFKVRSTLIVTAAIIVAFTMLRFFFLPEWMGDHIQKKLKNIPEYDISYEDFDISVLTLSYSIKDILLIKKTSRLPLPFFQCDRITFKLDAGSLLDDQWVSKVSVIHPVINFINGPDEISSQTKISSAWVYLIEELATIPIDKMSITLGEINYHDYHSIPKVLLHMDEIFLNGDNLGNGSGEETLLSGTVAGSGKVADGSISVKMELNAFHDKPMFKLTAELLQLNLSDVRDFLKAYGNIEIQQGIFSLYTEAATKNDKVVGFIKPIIEDVAIASTSENNNNFELIRPSTDHENHVWLMTLGNNGNQNEIRFEGNLDEPGMNIWSAAAMTLHNAFLEALVNSLKKSVKLPNIPAPRTKPKDNPATTSNLDSPKKENIFKRIFKHKDEKQKKK